MLILTPSLYTSASLQLDRISDSQLASAASTDEAKVQSGTLADGDLTFTSSTK